MELLWFLMGLAIGLLLLSWHHAQLGSAVQRIAQGVTPRLYWRLPATDRILQTIRAQRQTQEQLSAKMTTWQQIVQLAPIGFLHIDEENQLLWSNFQAGQLLDIQQPARPRLLLELVRSYELDQLIDQTRTAHQPRQREWIFHPVSADQPRLSQQQPRLLRAYCFPLEQGAVGVFLESRQETQQLIQQRDRWTSDVAHELKTPLTSIRLVAEMLQPRLEPPLKNWIDRLLQETIRLSDLVQDLLDLSHLEASTSYLTLKPVDLAKLIQATWLSLEPVARQKSLRLTYTGPDSLLIQADEPRLHRVLLNLLDNSIKYSPVRQVIQVQLSQTTDCDRGQTQGQAHLEVIDFGAGFPEAALPHVFDRFFRADPSRSRSRSSGSSDLDSDRLQSRERGLPVPVSHGSGLGLAIVRQIIEAHGGSVKASNHPETQGAWLQVFLPLQPAIETINIS